jgi:hypothetical protein
MRVPPLLSERAARARGVSAEPAAGAHAHLRAGIASPARLTAARRRTRSPRGAPLAAGRDGLVGLWRLWLLVLCTRRRWQRRVYWTVSCVPSVRHTTGSALRPRCVLSEHCSLASLWRPRLRLEGEFAQL